MAVICKNYFLLTYKNCLHVQNRSCMKSNVVSGIQSVGTEYAELRKKFWELEKVIERNVNYCLLTEKEKEIHKAHNEAVKKGHFSYDDPFTKEKILTRLRHFLKNTCCGKACRHVSEILCHLACIIILTKLFMHVGNVFFSDNTKTVIRC